MSSRMVAALLLGGSALALHTAAAAAEPQAYCAEDSGRPCGPLTDDGAVERRSVGPNLETGDGASGGAFRVSVDGVPEGAGPADRADRQRGQDKALAEAELQVRVTGLDPSPVLSVVPSKPVVAVGEAAGFHVLTNYAAFIARAELRIFDAEANVDAPPLTVVPVRFGEPVLWAPGGAQERAFRVVLRVYDEAGRFDETSAQPLALTTSLAAAAELERKGPLFENQRLIDNIPVRGAEVAITGTAPAADARVTAFGAPVPVDGSSRFLAQQIVPADTRQVTVVIAGGDGPARELKREIVIPSADHFLVGMIDVTGGHRSFGSAKRDLLGEDGDYRGAYLDGRLAFYLKRRINPEWSLTASADTGEHALEDLFDSFGEKDPRSFLRRLDPERHYPVYGDDSTTVEDAPTYGRFYLRAESDNALGMWGNFQTQIAGNELLRYQRSLYGANLGWRSGDSIATGERRTEVTAFAADPGTISSREEFASTGGSVYYLRNRDIVQGSERVFVEVRDRDSGLVIDRKELVPARDYDVNYVQGRVLLRQSTPITADASMFVRQSSLAGHPVWIVATYEYSTDLARPDTFTTGGRAQHWLGNHVRIGAGAYHQGEDQANQTLLGGDLLLIYKPGTFLRIQGARADGAGNGALLSSTGGYDFTELTTTADNADAGAVEFAADLAELTGKGQGQIGGYWRARQAGFSAPGELTFGESLDQYGGSFDIALGAGLTLKGKGDFTEGSLTERHAIEAGVKRETERGWFGGLGLRSDKQQGQLSAYSPIYTTPSQEGVRTDAALTLGYRRTPTAAQGEDAGAPWSLSAFGQKTVDRDGGRLRNDRFGVGGDYQVNDRLTLRGELSDGDLGFGADTRADYVLSDRGSVYLGYVLAAENPDSFGAGDLGRLGRLTTGTRYRYGAATSVFAEGRYEHGEGPTGWTQAYGVDFTPLPGWNFGGRYETGKLADAMGLGIERQVIGATADYGGERLKWSTVLEFRTEEGDQYEERRTWATRNQATWKASEALRLFAKADMSLSDAQAQSALDADYYEVALAGAYRPVDDDRLNLLTKYTYLYDLPSPAQVSRLGLNLDYAQRSHIFAADVTYQLTSRLAVGGKVAYRLGELRASRDETAPWLDSQALFWAVRADYRVIRRWDLLVEARELSVREAADSRLGGLVGVYRHFGSKVKLGVGYNFTDFSDDLSDLSYDEHGAFINAIGKF